MTRRGTSLVCSLMLAIAAWPASAQLASADTTTLPAGFGTLRQDDIALKVVGVGSVVMLVDWSAGAEFRRMKL